MKRRTRGRARLGPRSLIVSPSRVEVRAALEGLPADLPWDELKGHLTPVFVRRRPLPAAAPRPVMVRHGAGLEFGLGVDVGPAFMYVSHALLESWSVDLDEATEVAMDNLRATARAERCVELEYATIADMPLWAYQSRSGLASALLLLPDELALRYGDQPQLLIAPMRNLLLSAPFDADRELVAWLRDEISTEDPNGLDLPVFALVDGRLSVDRRAADTRLRLRKVRMAAPQATAATMPNRSISAHGTTPWSISCVGWK
jgi:hypothetical protein